MLLGLAVTMRRCSLRALKSPVNAVHLVSMPTNHRKSLLFEYLLFCCDFVEGLSAPHSVSVASLWLRR